MRNNGSASNAVPIFGEDEYRSAPEVESIS